MSTLFGRAVRVVVGSTLIEGLRVQLKVKKTSDKTPNTGHVTIYNLAEQSRAALKNKGTRLIIEAGYSGTIAQIFSGDSNTVNSTHEGPNWLTKVECVDGEKAYRYKPVAESFKAGTSVAAVFERIALKTGLDVQAATALVRQQISEQFTGGYSAIGQASAEIDKLLKGRGLEWSVQDGRLQVLVTGGTTQDQAVLLRDDTGLIGSPEYGTPTSEKKPQVLKARSLMQPSLMPGRKVRIEAANITGNFRALTVEHHGDTHSGDWFSDIEAVPL